MEIHFGCFSAARPSSVTTAFPTVFVLARLPWWNFSSYNQKVAGCFPFLAGPQDSSVWNDAPSYSEVMIWICASSCRAAVMRNPAVRRSTAGQYGALVLPAREPGRFSEASLKELGRAGGQRTSQIPRRWLLPQRKLKRCLSGESQSRRTFGRWALPKHTPWWLERPSLLQIWREKKSVKVLQFHLNFLSSFSTKNERWTFKVHGSALFDSLRWACPKHSPRPSESKLNLLWFPLCTPNLSSSQWLMVSCFCSFIFPTTTGEIMSL